MAQATSAQREPSMEEILASIRRIIEDSDTGKKPGEQVANEPAPTAASRIEASVIEVDAFRTELRGRSEAPVVAEPVAAEPVPAAPRKPMTLAEVQAEIMRSSPVPAPPQEPAVEAPPPPAVEIDEPPALVAREEDRTPAEPLVTRAPSAETFASLGTAVIPPAPKSAAPIAPMVTIDADEPRPAAPEPRPSRDAAPRSSILSEKAGKQIAAAFGELSEVFAESRKKSFDDMAEQMLRPMLQEWLDNNLPTLVERLVREEIERVARGG